MIGLTLDVQIISKYAVFETGNEVVVYTADAVTRCTVKPAFFEITHHLFNRIRGNLYVRFADKDPMGSCPSYTLIVERYFC
ncbi:MAG: hypothetical protein DHS20C01_10410 [marine bacterium B5-7]|nr:MAG: hypothetical protein DHS20C01_10410 [marine bacterium B5-7]